MSELTHMSDEDMLDQIETYRRSDENGWHVDVDTGEYFIIISPIGQNMKIDHIKDCQKVLVELYDHGEMPSSEDLKMPDMAMPDGTTISFNVQCFPHTYIRPLVDVRFKERPWAKQFVLMGAMAPTGTCTLEELCDIIRYCVKLGGLKAFL